MWSHSKWFRLVPLLALGACTGEDAVVHIVEGGVGDSTTQPVDEAGLPLEGGPDLDGNFPPPPPPDQGSGALCGVNGRDDCGAFKLCVTTLGCVDCASDLDCPVSAQRCVTGSCVVCAGDFPDAGVDGGPEAGTDCPASAPSCWPADHTCHASCSSPASCPGSAKICNAPSGACLGCSTSADCPGGACSPSTKQCVQCTSDSNCSGALPRCNVLLGVCEQCRSNVDCGHAAPVCDHTTFKCRVGCIDDTQCPGLTCDPVAGACVAIPAEAGVADAGAG